MGNSGSSTAPTSHDGKPASAPNNSYLPGSASNDALEPDGHLKNNNAHLPTGCQDQTSGNRLRLAKRSSDELGSFKSLKPDFGSNSLLGDVIDVTADKHSAVIAVPSHSNSHNSIGDRSQSQNQISQSAKSASIPIAINYRRRSDTGGEGANTGNQNNNSSSFNNNQDLQQLGELFTRQELQDAVCGSPLNTQSLSSSIPYQPNDGLTQPMGSVGSDSMSTGGTSQSFLGSSFGQDVSMTPLLTTNFIPPSVASSRKSSLSQPFVAKHVANWKSDGQIIPNDLGIMTSSQGSESVSSPTVLPPLATEEPQKQQSTKSKQMQDQTIPTLISWNNGMPNAVYVTGTFNEWKEKIPLQKGRNDFTYVLNLRPGTHRIKFIVDGQWRCSNDLDTTLDTNGNLVNYFEVREDDVGKDVVDILETSSHSVSRLSVAADALSTPLTESTFSQTIPDYLKPDDKNSLSPPATYQYPTQALQYPMSMGSPLLSPQSPSRSTTVDPPTLPPHLDRPVLNATYTHPKSSHNAQQQNQHQQQPLNLIQSAIPNEDAQRLPIPYHVCLNHMYALSVRDNVMGLASSRRYRNKYATLVYYRPTNRL